MKVPALLLMVVVLLPFDQDVGGWRVNAGCLQDPGDLGCRDIYSGR